MNQSFYTGAVGAQQHLRHLNVVSNNIANINTYGFKAERAQFSALMYQNMRAVEDPVLAGVGGRVQMTSTNFHPGGVADTGRSMDYMIEGATPFSRSSALTKRRVFISSALMVIIALGSAFKSQHTQVPLMLGLSISGKTGRRPRLRS